MASTILKVNQGGTGLSSVAANSILLATSTNVLGVDAGFTYTPGTDTLKVNSVFTDGTNQYMYGTSELNFSATNSSPYSLRLIDSSPWIELSAATYNDVDDNLNVVHIGGAFTPSGAGASTYTSLLIDPTINETSGHAGDSFGLAILPTLTSVGGNFYGIYGNISDANSFNVALAGTSPSYFAGPTMIGDVQAPQAGATFEVNSTTGGLLVPRMTTTQRNALAATPEGLLIYNTTLDAFQFYQNSAWVSLAAPNAGGIYAGSGTVPAATTANAPSGFDMDSAGTGNINLGDLDSIGYGAQLNITLGGVVMGGPVDYIVADAENSWVRLASASTSVEITDTAVLVEAPYLAIRNHTNSNYGELRIYEKLDSGNNYFALKARDLAADYTYLWPADYGTSGHFLKTDGAGGLTWAAASGGSGINDGDTLSVGLTFPNTGLHILDTNASHDLILSPGSDLTADRTLSVVTGDSNRTLTFSGDATISGTNTGDVSLAGTPDYITISGQVITRNAVDLTTDVTGTLPVANGGTGLSSLGSNNQLLRVNSGGTALEYFTGNTSNVIHNGGNTTGAAITIGTNDAFGLNLETNNVTRMAITGGASTGGAVTITNVTANTNTVQDVLTMQVNSTGTAAASFGAGILFQGESSTTDNQDMARISSYWTTATHASREAAISFQLGDSGGALAEVMKIDRTTSNGLLTIGSSSGLQISSTQIFAPGTLTILGQSSSSSAIAIHTNSSNVASSVDMGAANSYAQTSGDKKWSTYTASFAPTSGTATFTNISGEGTINQTGGANGITSFITTNKTLTSAADYRAIRILENSTSAWGIYQSGVNTKNHMNGHLLLGTTTDQSGYNMSSAGPIRTEAGHVLVRGAGNPASSTAAAAIRIVNTTGSEIFDLGVEDDDEVVFITATASEVAKITTEGIMQFNYGIRSRQQANAQTGTTYTLVLADEGKLVTLSNASAITLTVPPNASVAFPIGTIIDVCQMGAGQVTISPGSGVTVNAADSANKLRVQYSAASLVKTATNTWLLFGDISA